MANFYISPANLPFYFKGNPINVSVSDKSDSDISYIVTDVASGTVIYNGIGHTDGIGMFSADISNLFADLVTWNMRNYSVKVTFSDNTTATSTFYVATGGCAFDVQDLVTARLLSNSGNFMLSSRSGSENVYVSENELGNIYLYNFPSGSRTVIVKNGTTTLATYTFASGHQIMDIDLASLRKSKAAAGYLYSSFDIYSNNTFAFRIIVTQSFASPYRLIFRNSFGVYDIIQINGLIKYMPEFNDDIIFNEYDPFHNTKLDIARRTTNEIYIAKIGYDYNKMLVKDLLYTGKAILSQLLVSELTVSEKRFDVIVTNADNVTLNDTDNSFNEITLRLQFVYNNNRVTNASEVCDFVLRNENSVPITDENLNEIIVNEYEISK